MKGENNRISIRLTEPRGDFMRAQPDIYYDNINYDSKYVTK